MIESNVKFNVRDIRGIHTNRLYNIIFQEKGFHNINGIYKPYIIRDVLDTSNVNSVIILNT